MTNEITKPQKCILMRSGIQIWGDAERLDVWRRKLQDITTHKFVDFDGEIFNTADLEGVYSPQRFEELTRRKNGEWKCRLGTWHGRTEQCECARIAAEKAYNEEQDRRMQEIRNAPPPSKKSLDKFEKDFKNLVLKTKK